jgi:hypothetical protein
VRDEEVREFPLKVRPEVVEQKIISPEDAGWNDNIGIDCPVGQLEPPGKNPAPAFRLAAGVLIADQQRRLNLLKKGFERIVGVAAQNEAYPARGGILGDIPQALLQEVVVAQVGIGIIGDDGKKHDHWEAEPIAGLDGDIERRVVIDAHRPLHPVDDATAVIAGRTGAADQHAGLIG